VEAELTCRISWYGRNNWVSFALNFLTEHAEEWLFIGLYEASKDVFPQSVARLKDVFEWGILIGRVCRSYRGANAPSAEGLSITATCLRVLRAPYEWVWNLYDFTVGLFVHWNDCDFQSLTSSISQLLDDASRILWGWSNTRCGCPCSLCFRLENCLIRHRGASTTDQRYVWGVHSIYWFVHICLHG